MNWVLKKQVKVQSHKGPHPWHAILVGKRHKQTTFQKSLNIPARSQWNFGHLELPRSQCIFHLVLRLHARWLGRGMILSSAHLQKKGLQGSNSTKMISRSEMFQSPTGQSKTWWNAWKTIISQAFIFLVKHNTKNCHSVDFWGRNWIKAFFGKTSASTSLTWWKQFTAMIDLSWLPAAYLLSIFPKKHFHRRVPKLPTTRAHGN